MPVERPQQISIRDRGLRYGDGCFRTLRITDGEITLWQQHRKRFEHDAQMLGIAMPNDWQERARQVASGEQNAVLRITLTRGEGERGYAPPADAVPSLLFETGPLPALASELALHTRLCALRLGSQPALAGIKHLNRLEQVLARAEWDEGAHEGLLLDQSGNLIGGTMTNLFTVSGGCLYTPQLRAAGVAGAMREWVLDVGAGQAGLECRETDLGLDDLRNADEVFLTNAVLGLKPVTAVNGDLYGIGAITRQLQAELGAPFAES